jgi:hypothetical protein
MAFKPFNFVKKHKHLLAKQFRTFVEVRCRNQLGKSSVKLPITQMLILFIIRCINNIPNQGDVWVGMLQGIFL